MNLMPTTLMLDLSRGMAVCEYINELIVTSIRESHSRNNRLNSSIFIGNRLLEYFNGHTSQLENKQSQYE